MKVKSLIIIILASAACMLSCKKTPLSIGEITTQQRTISTYFDKVKILDNINLTFVKSDCNKVEITTGKNLIDNILTEVNTNDSVLTIKNDNKLDWIRPYDYTLDLKLYYKDINYVLLATSGNVSTENQFNSDTIYNPHPGDTLTSPLMYVFEIDGASGEIDLTLNNCPYLFVNYEYGTCKVVVHGENNQYFRVRHKSYGDLNAIDYQAERVSVTNKSVGDCYVQASERITAAIDKNGNIYYKGEPVSIDCIYGPNATGRLIKTE